MRKIRTIEIGHSKITKGVIFDLDGTLIDSLDTFTRAFNQGIGKFGHKPVSRATVADFMNNGITMEKLLVELFPDTFEKEENIDRLREEFKKAYLELEVDSVRLIPGAEEALSRLREMGLKIGIVTARLSLGEDKWRELRRLGIDHYIDTMVTGAEAERKPAAGSLLECIRRLGLSPAECVMVGDSRVDILTGRAASVITIVLPNGVATREALSRENPDVILHSLADLPGYISTLL